jgi:hypothetical protein
LKLRQPAALAAAACLACLLLASCVDAEATARIGPDGSGDLELSLLVSRMVAPIASLGTDRRLLPFPLSKEDFDRAVARDAGLGLASYSREDGDESISIKAKIAFANPTALASFLDPSGKRALYSEEGGRRSLKLVLAEGGSIDPDLARLADVAFSTYRVSLALLLPTERATAALTPPEGAGSSSVSGTKAEYSNSTAALMKSAEPIEWEIVW